MFPTVGDYWQHSIFLQPAPRLWQFIACSHKKCVNSSPENHTAETSFFLAWMPTNEYRNDQHINFCSQQPTIYSFKRHSEPAHSLFGRWVSGEVTECNSTWMFVLPPNKYNKQVLHNFSGELAQLIFKASYPVNFQVKSTYSKCQTVKFTFIFTASFHYSRNITASSEDT